MKFGDSMSKSTLVIKWKQNVTDGQTDSAKTICLINMISEPSTKTEDSKTFSIKFWTFIKHKKKTTPQ